MGISEEITVLDYGAKIAERTPSEARADPKAVEAYLGKAGVTLNLVAQRDYVLQFGRIVQHDSPEQAQPERDGGKACLWES